MLISKVLAFRILCICSVYELVCMGKIEKNQSIFRDLADPDSVLTVHLKMATAFKGISKPFKLNSSTLVHIYKTILYYNVVNDWFH